MRSLLMPLLMLVALALGGCLVAVDDGEWPDPGPSADGLVDGGTSDAGTEDGGLHVDAFWPYQHRPEDCPEEAARARGVCDPSCDGVSHFYCADNPSDSCCACLRLGGGGGNGGGQGGGNGGGTPSDGQGGNLPPRPPPPPR